MRFALNVFGYEVIEIELTRGADDDGAPQVLFGHDGSFERAEPFGLQSEERRKS